MGTKKQAQAQLTRLLNEINTGVYVQPSKLTVADYLDRVTTVALHICPVEERDRLRSYQSGCNSFVRKPLDFSEFAQTVARLGIYWVATNEPV